MEYKTEENGPPVRRIGVLGAGVMGVQIAAHFANAGYQVMLLDMAQPAGDRSGVARAALAKALKMSPPPFALPSFADRITPGNFDDDLNRLSECDWILEAVIEDAGIKKALWSRVAAVAPAHAILSTNTSGIPIRVLVEGLPEGARNRFLGTHFFNPPRFLHLFEVIPGPDTRPELVERVNRIARERLGKGVVIAKDTPNFIANRIGTYAMLGAMAGLEQGLTIEEVDALTGPLTGRPKSATFRTADVVGLDTLAHVCRNLYAAIPHDPARERFRLPALLEKLIENKNLGAKTKSGFYRKQGESILTAGADGKTYSAAAAMDLPGLDIIQKMKDPAARWKALFADKGRAGTFIRSSVADMLWYAAQCIPEISDHPGDVDRALRWGFGWDQGPFEIWDMIGFDAVVHEIESSGRSLPGWVQQMKSSAQKEFRTGESGKKVSLMRPVPVYQNPEFALLDSGDGILVAEFRSKANAISAQVVEGLIRSVDLLEHGAWAGMVIGNDGPNFSVGANLAEMMALLDAGDFNGIDRAIARFQIMVQRIRYADKPVVAAVRGKVLGGGCEISMACAGVAASMETYVGLVELAAGLIPAGTGTMHLACQAAERAGSDLPSHAAPFLMRSFELVASARVSGSSYEAVQWGLLPQNTVVVMHEPSRLESARQIALGMARAGYRPPVPRRNVLVGGRNAWAALASAAWQMQQAGMATEYDRHLAERLAWVMTGGPLTGASSVPEQYLLDLERQVFVELIRHPKTRERIAGIFSQNKPVRN